jgi:SNF2 family DNA or RNA helicase
MKEKGEKLFRDGLVSNIKGKKIEGVYHIYGEIINNSNSNGFNTYLKVNLLNKQLVSVECNCQEFKEHSAHKSLYMCEHIIATVYKLLSLIYNRTVRDNKLLKDLPTKNREKIEVGIDVRISHKKWKGITNYELEFRLGTGHKFLISDLKGLVCAIDNKKSFYFNNQFIYNPVNYAISPDDEKILNFIKECVHENKCISSTGRNLIVMPNNIREFLECIGENKVQFKYNAIEYKSLVLKEDLPLSFTLKEKNEYIVLTTHKKLPIPLNENRDVYLFNWQIYLPSKNQIQKYVPLYNKFRKKDEILYNKTIENYSGIISTLNSISNDITISEGVKRFGANSLKLEFLIYKEKSDIYCNVKAIYYNKEIDILDDHRNKSKLIRDFNKEDKVLMKLEYYRFIRRNHRLLFIGDDEDLFNILNKDENSLYSLGTVILGNGLQGIKIYNSTSIELNFYDEVGYFKFDYNIGNLERTELSRIFESYKSDNRFYKTKSNGFIDFEDKGIRTLLNLIEVLNIDENIEEGAVKLEKNKALYLAESLKGRNFKFGKGFDILKDIENKLTYINNNEIAIPSNFKAELREYQVNGFKWFINLSQLEFGGILADEMGLGKTVQTIAFLMAGKNKKTLIIMPTSLIYNWKDEIERFAPDLRVGIAHGTLSEQDRILNNLEEYEVILTTYGTLRNNIKKYSNIQFDYCIIDEAQNIKNALAQITKAVKEIEAKVKFALTGTPIENNLTELWSIFDFIMPGYLYSKQVFDKKFIFNKECDLEDLKLLIKPFVLRRTKEEVIKDLPNKIEKKILVEMTTTQKSIYSSYIKDIRARIKSNPGGKIEVFSYLTKLRQICLDPSLIFKDYEGGSGKFKVAMVLVEKQLTSRGKLILFSQFTSALHKIGKSLKEKGIEYFYLDGSTSPKERIRLVNEFNNNGKVKVFLISLKAGGTGLNLTSASLVIHFDPWWNPAVEDQATDRAHRIGQKNVVEVIKLVARGTIEEKIILMQEHKKELINNIITGELKNSSLINKLSKEEVLKLFDRD